MIEMETGTCSISLPSCCLQPGPAVEKSRNTGHEHYDRFRIINANARLYDPVIGRFFSPNPFVQAPDFTQNYNRYSYCMNNPVMYSDPDGENPLLIAAAYFIFFTDPGYELQKYVSPVAVNIDFRWGTHQQGIGFNVSYGIPKSLPYAKRWDQGSSYYWKNYGGYSGYEHRKGSEQSVMGLYHWGETHYESGEFTQTVGKKSFGIPSTTGVDVSNDLWGDGGDRFRTSHQRINLVGISIGNSIFTGDPGPSGEREIDRSSGPYGTYTGKNNPYGDPDKYRHGLLYVGIGPIKIGYDSESIRNFIQNGFHDKIGSPRFRNLCGTPEYEAMGGDKFYFQFGWDWLW